MSGPPVDSARSPRAPSPGRPASRSLRAQRGQVTWVSLLLLVILAGGGYLGWVWLPVYFENYAVKQVVRDYMNQAIKNTDDEGLRRAMVQKIRSLAQVDGIDAWGRPAVVAAVQLSEGDVAWERDAASQPPLLRVTFDYARDVTYPILERTSTKVFTIDLTNELTRADWGPAR